MYSWGLSQAIANDDVSAATDLIDAGADVNDTQTSFFGERTLLFEAVEKNKEAMVQLLIDAGADVNKVCDGYGARTVLFHALQNKKQVQNKKQRMAQLLIEAGADVNAIDVVGQTPLLYCVEDKDEEMVHVLIDAGADVNRTDTEGKTALFYAVQQSNNESVFPALIDAGADVNITENERKINHERLVHALIAAGTDVNITDNKGKTALFYAVQQSNNESVVHTLIDAGTNVNITDNKGKTALFYAVQQWNNESVVHTLIDAGTNVNITDNEGKSALFYAVQQSNNERLVRALIAASTDVNITDNEGKTAFFFAVQQSNNESLVRALIDAGAEVNKTDNEGKTALFYAVDYEREFELSQVDLDSSMVKRLIDVGANVNIQNNSGETALFLAVQSQYMYMFSVASLLIKAGVDVNIKNNYGKTALIWVCENDHSGDVKDNESMVQGLIGAGADINATDSDGNTALIRAVACKNKKIVHKLIEAGADVNIRTKEVSKTALICAFQCIFDYKLINFLTVKDNDATDVYIYPLDNQEESIVSTTEIVQMLIEKGNANVDARDVYGRTPLFYAIPRSIPLSSYLIEKGANVMVRDNFNLTILSVLIENCVAHIPYGNYLYPSLPLDMDKGLDLLIQHGMKNHAIFDAIVNVVFCKTLLFSQFKSSCQRTEISWLYNILEVARKYTTIFCKKMELKEKKIIDNILTLVRSTSVTVNGFYECLVPKILPQLIKLGANPNSVDFYGNTALHYASCLPSYGLSKDTVINICHLLESFGASFNVRNMFNETPLLFCCNIWDLKSQEYDLEELKTLVEVRRFLLNYGSNVEETTRDGHSVFHFVLMLFNRVKHSLLNYQKEKEFKNETMKLLELICQRKLIKNHLAINKKGDRLNSPLHLWASLEGMSADEYDEDGIYSFRRNVIRTSFKLLTEFGAELNDVNENGKTPLHFCETWTGVNLLLDAGANPNVIDSEGRSPLLAAAKKGYFGQNGGLYMDVFPIDPEGFWKTALKKGLDPWLVDKHGESVLSVIVKKKAFVLAKALVEVARDGNYLQSDTISSSLLNAVCRDESTGTYWKSILVEIILKSGKRPHSGNDNEDSPLHFCCRNVAKSYKTSSCNDDNVHWTIAKNLLQYGADCRIPGAAGQTCLDLAAGCPPLQDLLLKPIDIEEVPIVIPWNSVSEVYKSKLAKVARTRDSKHVKEYWYHEDELQSGSFGVVFAGINEKDGREVAIKRIEKRHMQRPEDKREITNLTALADCEQVVSYFYYVEDEHFSYVVLELMEGNLDEFLTKKTPMDTRKKLCQDVVKGLRYLHSENILHRDLKPTNILFKTHPGLCLKIADFGLSRRIDSNATTVYSTNAGTRCWIAPDVLKSIKAGDQHSKASDMFSCGLVLHYILSVKKHPFAPADCANKSELQIEHETVANILNGRMEGWDNSLCPEATHLVKTMLESDDSKRPAADKALDHPFFWTKQKKVDLLIAVGNQPEFECPRAKRTSPLSAVETDLETNFGTIVKYVDWNDPGYVHMPAVYTEMTKKRRYDTKSVVELVRFVRNATAHVSESIRPPPIRKQLLEDFVFLEYFPNLVMEVYKAVTTHGYHTREEIKYTMLKK